MLNLELQISPELVVTTQKREWSLLTQKDYNNHIRFADELKSDLMSHLLVSEYLYRNDLRTQQLLSFICNFVARI